MPIARISTPLGTLLLEETEGQIATVSFQEHLEPVPAETPLLENVSRQFEEYFAGTRLEFDFPQQQAGTAFQQQVWHELSNIPIGYPISYTALSRKMNNPLAIRAIAAANGKNKLAIVVPCHRVIGNTGDLVGYAGGLWRKKWLLEHEARMVGIGQTLLF